MSGKIYCDVCTSGPDIKLWMLHWHTEFDAAQGTTPLRLCNKCGPVVRSFFVLLSRRVLKLSLRLEEAQSEPSPTPEPPTSSDPGADSCPSQDAPFLSELMPRSTLRLFSQEERTWRGGSLRISKPSVSR